MSRFGEWPNRFRAVIDLTGGASSIDVDADPLGALCEQLDQLGQNPSAAATWLWHCAVTGAWPTRDELALAVDGLASASVPHRWAIDRWLDHPDLDVTTPMRVVSDSVLIDVSRTGASDYHTGIQRVVRSSAPYWVDRPGCELVAWNQYGSALRPLTARERERVVNWDHYHRLTKSPAETAGIDELLVPWRSTLILAEAVDPGLGDVILGARDAGNRVGVIGYDLIPVVSPDLVPFALVEHFVGYLDLVAGVDDVAAISAAAGEEFAGLAELTRARGGDGPAVHVRPLPMTDRPDHAVPEPPGVPRILAVGSFEPRKNHVRVLTSAERLWREGLEFEVHLVGGMAWDPEAGEMIDSLIKAGRPLHRHLAVSEDALAEQYRRARFAVQLSLHEGYGLPVVEALAVGTPVVASNFGSVAEIATGGGCVLIDPRDEEAVTATFRDLLTNGTASLRDEIPQREVSTWAEYADGIWDTLAGAGSTS